jgi:hypothetical protein
MLRFRGLPMSGNVGSDISESGVVANVGVDVGTASPSLSVQTLFLLPVSWPTINHILPFRGRPMSGNVGSDIPESGMVTNVGVAVEIASLSASVQELFLLPVSWPTINHILPFRGRPMTGNVGSDISESGVVANVGVAVGTASPSLSVLALFLLPVSWPTF